MPDQDRRCETCRAHKSPWMTTPHDTCGEWAAKEVKDGA